jgi:hypothetical protein
MTTSFLNDLETLYFVFQAGCEACEAAEADLRAFEARHPTVQVLRLNAWGPYPERIGLKVKATPTYLFRRGEQGAVREGVLAVADLEAWLGSLGATGFEAPARAPRKRRPKREPVMEDGQEQEADEETDE